MKTESPFSEQEQAIAADKKPLTPKELGDLYALAMWGVASVNVCDVTADNLMLRAITVADWQTGADGGIMVDKNSIDILEHAVAYEVIDQGPDVSKDRRGEHCLHFASSADTLSPDGTGEFVIVREKDIALFWNPRVALERVRVLVEQMRAAKESQVIRQSLLAPNVHT